MMDYIESYLSSLRTISLSLNRKSIDEMVNILEDSRDNDGRLFILGVGGSAANASHAVNDFRKICGIETYAPTDNIAELTARTNDNGWDTVFEDWLKVSKLNSRDTVMVFSVSGGNEFVSQNIVKALNYAMEMGSYILGIVGKDGGYTAKMISGYGYGAILIIPTIDKELITPLVESYHSIIWHLIANHPKLKL